MEAPLRLSLDLSAHENYLTQLMAQHRLEVLAELNRISQRMEAILSETLNNRQKMEAEFDVMAARVVGITTAADSILTVVGDLRGMVNRLIDEAADNQISPAYIQTMRDFSAALEAKTNDLVSATVANLTDVGSPPRANDGRVGAQARPAQRRAAQDEGEAEELSPDERAQRDQEARERMRLEREAGLNPLAGMNLMSDQNNQNGDQQGQRIDNGPGRPQYQGQQQGSAQPGGADGQQDALASGPSGDSGQDQAREAERLQEEGLKAALEQAQQQQRKRDAARTGQAAARPAPQNVGAGGFVQPRDAQGRVIEPQEGQGQQGDVGSDGRREDQKAGYDSGIDNGAEELRRKQAENDGDQNQG